MRKWIPYALVATAGLLATAGPASAQGGAATCAFDFIANANNGTAGAGTSVTQVGNTIQVRSTAAGFGNTGFNIVPTQNATGVGTPSQIVTFDVVPVSDLAAGAGSQQVSFGFNIELIIREASLGGAVTPGGAALPFISNQAFTMSGLIGPDQDTVQFNSPAIPTPTVQGQSGSSIFSFRYESLRNPGTPGGTPPNVGGGQGQVECLATGVPEPGSLALALPALLPLALVLRRRSRKA